MLQIYLMQQHDESTDSKNYHYSTRAIAKLASLHIAFIAHHLLSGTHFLEQFLKAFNTAYCSKQ